MFDVRRDDEIIIVSDNLDFIDKLKSTDYKEFFKALYGSVADTNISVRYMTRDGIFADFGPGYGFDMCREFNRLKNTRLYTFIFFLEFNNRVYMKSWEYTSLKGSLEMGNFWEYKRALDQYVYTSSVLGGDNNGNS